MRSLPKITVQDILKRSYFQSAEVVAGQRGLDRCVRWAHIMEVTEIGQLLNGNEIILSTGVGWKEKEIGLSLLRQLTEHGVSALCVELGSYIDEIPDNMIVLADQYNFPLIVFHQEVRFIDITQDINGLLMDTEDKMMSDLESYSNKINRLLLSTDGFNKILRYLREYLDTQVVYIPFEDTTKFFPDVEGTQQNVLLKEVQCPNKYHIQSHSIEAFGHKFADLAIMSLNPLTDFNSLVLDRTATALAQEQLRILYVEEKRKYQENQWVEEWLDCKLRKHQIEQNLFGLEPSLEPNGCVVCLLKVDLSKQETEFTFSSMIFRSIFEQKGFFLLTTYKLDQVIFTLINKRSKTQWKERMANALEDVQKTDFMQSFGDSNTNFGVGKLVDELEDLNYSYQLAMEVVQIKDKIGEKKDLFYEDLHVYRIILQMNKTGNLAEFVMDYLKPVLVFDDKHQAQMFETLKVYLEVHGSKKEAAEKLFIVRQTLYHRIGKLKELLGEDFMESEKRLAIEIAVYGHVFLDEY